MTTAVPKLFSPAKVGNVTIQHRVVLAPLTRFRAQKSHTHSKMAIEYYTQRACVPGTMMISEATFIAPQAGGLTFVPGIWNQEQIEAWKPIVEAVHAKGSFIYMQLWALGRAAEPSVLENEGPYPYVSASDVTHPERKFPPRPLTTDEVKQYVKWYAQAAANAVHGAGFDGIEIHGANGYLVDQFIQDVTNKRTDEYGGSIENRARFALEVIDAIVEKIGPERTGIRLSPWGNYGGMRMAEPMPQFAYVVQKIKERQPNLAFIHLVEPRVDGIKEREVPAGVSNDFIREIWAPRPLITAGGYTRDLALEVAETKGDLIGFGRPFIPNPDLPLRLKKNLPLVVYNRKTFYDTEKPEGYIDYPFAPENVADLGPTPSLSRL